MNTFIYTTLDCSQKITYFMQTTQNTAEYFIFRFSVRHLE